MVLSFSSTPALIFFSVLFSSQVVLSFDFKFSLPEVQQCEPVSITFLHNVNVSAAPMSLTLLPFASRPVFVPIPNVAANSSGISVSFFPFSAGTNFLAALTDTSGQIVAPVSDVIRVLPSPSGNSSCLGAPQTNDSVPIYTVDQQPSQCQDFTVLYNRTVVTSPPKIRLYQPKGISFLLNVTNEDPKLGTADYLMNFSRNKEVLLFMDDGQNHQQTTSLLTVAGDSASSKDCLRKYNDNDADYQKPSNSSSSNTSTGISKTVLIGASAGGGAIILVLILGCLFVLRERQRRLSYKLKFDPALIEKGGSPGEGFGGFDPAAVGGAEPGAGKFTVNASRTPTQPVALGNGFVRDPPYTSEVFLSPTSGTFSRHSLSSWAQPLPDDQRSPPATATHAARSGSKDSVDLASRKDSLGAPVSASLPQDDRLSLNSLDIEGMLNMATVQSRRGSDETGDPALLVPHSPAYLYMHTPSLSPMPEPEPEPTQPANGPRNTDSGAAPQLSLQTENLEPPQPAVLRRPLPGRGHFRTPSGVPADLPSVAYSSYSMDPFGDSHHVGASAGLSQPHVAGLPSSPRNGRARNPQERNLSPVSSLSEGHYGIAR